MQKNTYKHNPYSHAGELFDKIREVAPDSLKYIVDQWLDDIVLFDNKITDATYQRTEEFNYKVDFSIETTKYSADGLGNEKEIPVQDYIIISVYNDQDKVLYSDRLFFDKKKSTFSIVIDRKPEYIVVDPCYSPYR